MNYSRDRPPRGHQASSVRIVQACFEGQDACQWGGGVPNEMLISVTILYSRGWSASRFRPQEPFCSFCFNDVQSHEL